MGSTYAERLGEHVRGLRYDDLPAPVVRQAKWCILDAIGVALAGTDKPWAQAVLNESRRQRSHGRATIWRYGDTSSDAMAAMVNGMFAHSMDFNDDIAGIQAGGLIPPTALAVAEEVGASGRDLIAATALGYDVAVRVADAINSQQLYIRGYQPTAVCGGFGATAVAGKLLGLDAPQLADAFGIAGSYAGGTIEFLKDGTDTKRYHVAKAAHGGVLSARLAAGGMNGPRTIFEGDYGLFRVCSADSRPERLLVDLGSRWDILDTSFKKYPFCDGNAAPLEATLALLRERRLAIDEVASFHYRIKTFLVPYCIDYHGDRARKFRPRTELDAQMSLPYCIAVGLLRDGELRVEDFDPSMFDDPRIHAIADRVDAEADPELDKVPLRPMSMPSIATLTTRDGRTHRMRVDYQRGDPRNPFTAEEYVAKFHACADGILGRTLAERVVDRVMGLEEIDDLSSLTAAVIEPRESAR
ncbi:MAG: 2-methylcitrate dehydratase [Betaproteobacteria bacterium]|nr:MAG: 2-methylcitrate dehydratase [Betaproteobacteria bacterium]